VNKLFIANKVYSSWSLRPWVLMKQLLMKFDEEVVPFGEGSNWAAYRQFSPTGKVPCLHTPQGAVWDSLAIAEYLAEKNHRVWPNDTMARAWARCAAAEMHSGFATLRSQCPMNCAIEVKLDQISSSLQADLNRLQEVWREGLSRFGGPFLAGSEFTAVDAFFCPVAFRVQTYGLPLDDVSLAYVQRLLSLPAMQLWREQALSEPWREAAHEAACVASGTLRKDHRHTGP
jgi:glutathione S-transferase